nr:phosphoenolpyruvate hydrolase family protein [Pleomorphomonas sp. NRK KF1]
MKNGEIVDRVTRSAGGFQIVCPHFAGLSAEEADLVGCLPTGDANGALLAAAGSLGGKDGVFAGILAADPFRPAPMLLGLIKEAGIRGVTNLPTVAGITDGLAEALSHAGVDYAAELETLAMAAEQGLDVIAVVRTVAQAREATAAGLRQLLAYPPFAGDDPSDRTRSAAITLDTAQVIRDAAPEATILAFRHPAYGSILAPLIAASDGVVDWSITRREMRDRAG